MSDLKPATMRSKVFIIAVVLFSATATAQVSPTKPDTGTIHDQCLLSTTVEDWNSLGLTSEQVQQVQAIQTACKTDCTATPETGTRDPKLSEAIMEKHRERFQKVLGDAQYEKWLEWCTTRPIGG